MQLVQMRECGGFKLTWADKLRKSIAKKNPAAYEELQKEYFETVEEKGLSRNLCNYVWNVLVATSRGSYAGLFFNCSPRNESSISFPHYVLELCLLDF